MPGHETYESMQHVYNAGTVHFLNMDTETWIDTAEIDAAQVAWIGNDLKTVNRTTQPWIIATGCVVLHLAPLCHG